jgi:hypothetical protein
MSCLKISSVLEATASKLDTSIHLSSEKYPKDLGSWGLDENKVDELIRHFKGITVELKVFDLNEEEFPNLKGKNLVELEINSDKKSEKQAIDILKRLKAFPIEEHHISNSKKIKEIKTAYNRVLQQVKEGKTPNLIGLKILFNDKIWEIKDLKNGRYYFKTEDLPLQSVSFLHAYDWIETGKMKIQG